MTSARLTACAIGVIALTAVGGTRSLHAQIAPGPVAGLRTRSIASAHLGTTPPIMQDAHGSSHWQEGALVGGLIGAALAGLIDYIVPDSQHPTLRVVEFTFMGAMIGGLIKAH